MNDKNRDELLSFASQKLGIDKNTMNSGGGKELLDKLSDKDREKVSKIMSDPSLTKKILDSPQAKSLLKNLFGDK